MKINRILFGTFFIFFSNFCYAQKSVFDERVVGKWEILFSENAEGIEIKDEFTRKGYINTYTKDGMLLLDFNYFKDDMKRHGIKEPLDYASIPSLSWKSIRENVMEIYTGQGNQVIRYGFSGDTLLLGYPNGNIQYLLKRK